MNFLLLDQKKVPKKNQEIAKAISRMARDQLSKAKTPPRLRRFLTLLIAFAAPISFFNSG